MIFNDFETAQEFLEKVLKLTIEKDSIRDIDDEFKVGYALYNRHELVNFCYSREELIEHAQYEFDICIKLIRETSKKDALFFYMDLLNFVREKGELLII